MQTSSMLEKKKSKLKFRLEQVKTFEQDQIDVRVLVDVLAMRGRRLFSEVSFDANRSLLPRRENQLHEHFVEAKRMQVECSAASD